LDVAGFVRVLALNPGSSSLKAALRESASSDAVYTKLIERVDSSELDAALAQVADELPGTPEAVAHRLVHGGPRHFAPTVIDDAVLADLSAAVPLAPLHLPGALEVIRHARAQWPSVPHVACFDTGFHRDLPAVAQRLPVPSSVAALGVRRYGFHGLSVQSVLLAHPSLGDAVIAHLGSGCSVTAVGADHRPRHTTMSLTPTGGVLSATRPGDLDPEIPLYLLDHQGFETDQLRDLFNHSSGLAGVADGRHDVRDLLAASDADAALALDMFVRDVAMAIAACATTLDDWASLVFTGGIGEHAADIRARIVARLRCNGVDVLVVPADEERVMDLQTRELLVSQP
jgi:acetate kinase